jgi:large subunit ribosomal protein L22
MAMVEARASAKFVRMSPRKARTVIDLIRGKPVNEALSVLRFTPRKAARIIEKTLRSAVANAKVTDGSGRLSESDLVVSKAVVDEGAPLKRFRASAMGRASQIRRRTSHVLVMVKGEPQHAPAPKGRRPARGEDAAKAPGGKTEKKKSRRSQLGRGMRLGGRA